MSGMALWLGLAAVELVLVLLVALAVSWWRNRVARARDRKAVGDLVARLQANRAERDARLRTMLADRFNLEDSALEAAAVPIAREELRLYQHFANAYLRRDAGAVAALDIAFEAAVDPYWRLDVAPAPEPAAPAETGELEHLRAENERLAEELQVTMNTMSRILNEYSATFALPEDEPAESPDDAAAPESSQPEAADGTVDELAPPGDESDGTEADVEAAGPAADAAPQTESGPVEDEILADTLDDADLTLEEVDDLFAAPVEPAAK